MTVGDRFARLSTATKLLLILTAAILPIGIALTWLGETGIRQANAALKGRGEDQSRAAAGAIESLIARNALALRVAANGRINDNRGESCERVRKSLSIAPAVSQSFEIEGPDGQALCSAGAIGDLGTLSAVAPGDIRVRVAPDADGIAIRAQVGAQEFDEVALPKRDVVFTILVLGHMQLLLV